MSAVAAMWAPPPIPVSPLTHPGSTVTGRPVPLLSPPPLNAPHDGVLSPTVAAETEAIEASTVHFMAEQVSGGGCGCGVHGGALSTPFERIRGRCGHCAVSSLAGAFWMWVGSC